MRVVAALFCSVDPSTSSKLTWKDLKGDALNPLKASPTGACSQQQLAIITPGDPCTMVARRHSTDSSDLLMIQQNIFHNLLVVTYGTHAVLEHSLGL